MLLEQKKAVGRKTVDGGAGRRGGGSGGGGATSARGSPVIVQRRYARSVARDSFCCSVSGPLSSFSLVFLYFFLVLIACGCQQQCCLQFNVGFGALYTTVHAEDCSSCKLTNLLVSM